MSSLVGLATAEVRCALDKAFGVGSFLHARSTISKRFSNRISRARILGSEKMPVRCGGADGGGGGGGAATKKRKRDRDR